MLDLPAPHLERERRRLPEVVDLEVLDRLRLPVVENFRHAFAIIVGKADAKFLETVEKGPVLLVLAKVLAVPFADRVGAIKDTKVQVLRARERYA